MPRPLSDLEDSVAKQIRQAIERGEFNNLPGAGKPLDLGDDANIPSDWRLAFKMLKDANVSPQWIEQDKEIRAEIKALKEWLEKRVAEQRRGKVALSSLALEKVPAEHLRLQAARVEAAEIFRRRANALNQMIDAFNLNAPSARLQHARVAAEAEIQKFLRACVG